MAYRIEYDKGGGKYEIHKEYPWRFPILVCSAAALFGVLTFALWPDGAAYVRDALIPGDNRITSQAVKLLTDDLRSGAGFGEAVESFCRLVIHGN